MEGETCSGSESCNATRCIRMEQQVCHCINGSFFCGPVACAPPDAGTPDAGSSDGGNTPACGNNTTTGDSCNPATDSVCSQGCRNGRTWNCFCNTLQEWACFNTNVRCQ
jgi:hypothetical protein